MQYILQCFFILNFAIQCLCIGGNAKMSFQIKQNRKETENKTIRFPIPLIDKIEKAIQGQNVTFSRFVIQACEYALNNIEDNKQDSK